MASFDFGSKDCSQYRQVTLPVERATVYLGSGREVPAPVAADPSNGIPKFLHIGLRHITQVKPSRSISGSDTGVKLLLKG